MERIIQPEDFMQTINAADMVLVGLGEEFDDTRSFREDAGYREGKTLLEGSDKSHLIPAWQSLFREDEAHCGDGELLMQGLEKLLRILDGKNYFVVSVSTNDRLRDIPWKDGRIAMPCGGARYKQCGSDCSRGVIPLEEDEQRELQSRLRDWRQSILNGESSGLPRGLGRCPECGEEWGLNNVYHVCYNEKGYQENWLKYTRWLQGTLNRRLTVLELGVGMQFPSVIRWPFEKVAFFNQKACFYRVNRNLYQLTEELAEKGTGIAENAIDWLQNLC